MFDNPEKLFIILIVALFIFGPQKLIGIGGAMGRAVRDFRSAVRDAHDQFSAAVEEAQRTEDAYAPEPLALPAPEPAAEIPMSTEALPASVSFEPAPLEAPATAPDRPAAEAADDEGPHSLASEPSSHAVLESLQESLQRKA